MRCGMKALTASPWTVLIRYVPVSRSMDCSKKAGCPIKASSFIALN